MSRWHLLAILGSALITSGCFSETVEPSDLGPKPAVPQGVRPTIVAVIDNGLNPYHNLFWRPESTITAEAWLPSLSNATFFSLTRGASYETSLANDSERWGEIGPGQLIAFNEGPISLVHLSSEPLPPMENVGHGTATTYEVLRASPHTLVVTIRVDAFLCTDAQRGCLLDPSVAAAMEWAADQPWIDIVTLSMGIHGHAPDRPEIHPEMERFLQASRKAAQQGKIVLNSAGNWILPATVDYFGGPPWLVSVGGVISQNQGDALQSSKGADVVSDYVVWSPDEMTTDGMDWGFGTSMATPRVAGIMAEAIYRLRQNLSHEGGIDAGGALARGVGSDGREVQVTSQALRDALNATGRYFSAADWKPALTVTNESHPRYVTPNAPVVAPFVQMGWGYVDANSTEEIVARVLADDLGVPAEKAAAAQYQATIQAAREAYWSQYQ